MSIDPVAGSHRASPAAGGRRTSAVTSSPRERNAVTTDAPMSPLEPEITTRMASSPFLVPWAAGHGPIRGSGTPALVARADLLVGGAHLRRHGVTRLLEGGCQAVV